MNNEDLYKPCPCGSGKKYKFCCHVKRRESAASRPPLRVLSGSDGDEYADFVDDPEWMSVAPELIDASRRDSDKGFKLMKKNHFRQAMPWFRKALERVPVVYTPANNLALCLFVTGDLDEAIAVQEQNLEDSPLPNPFGLANLATFYWIRGDEKAAKDYIEEAMSLPFPSVDTCIKICEVLARLKRHQAILDVADSSIYGDHSDVSFFSGVAAANLGKKGRAKEDLRRVGIGYHKADMARRYLQHLQERSTPQTVLGDWPYLLAFEICPQVLVEAEMKADEKGWCKRRILVQFTEALLNESADDPVKMLGLLAYATHPDANIILWTIVNGSFGPDALRGRALSMLQERGEVKADQPIEMLVNGKRTSVQSVGMKLNPEIRFGGDLPVHLEKIYTKAIQDAQKRNPNWKKVGEAYQEVIRELPEFYPARYNYATTLMQRERYAEAEPILRELTEQHPGYLFATSTLLQLYMMQQREAEAESLFMSVKMPEETHPSAMISWLAAQYLYLDRKGEYDAADQCLDMLRDLNPDHPLVSGLR